MLATAMLAVCSLQAIAEPERPEPLRPAFELAGHSVPVLDVEFSPNGKRLASVADDGMLRIWNVADRAEHAVFEGCAKNSNRLAWSHDAARIFTIGNDQAIRSWNVESKKELKALPVGDISGGAKNIALAPDSARLAVVGRSTLRIFDLATGQETSRHVVHEQYGVEAVAWSADGALIATGGTDRKVNLVNAKDGVITKTLDTEGRPGTIIIAPDSKTLYVATDIRLVQRFDVVTGEAEKLDLRSMPALDLQLSPDGKLLVIGGPGRGPALWDLATKAIREPKLESDDWVKPAAISPDGTLIAGGANGGMVSVWVIPAAEGPAGESSGSK